MGLASHDAYRWYGQYPDGPGDHKLPIQEFDATWSILDETEQRWWLDEFQKRRFANVEAFYAYWICQQYTQNHNVSSESFCQLWSQSEIGEREWLIKLYLQGDNPLDEDVINEAAASDGLLGVLSLVI